MRRCNAITPSVQQGGSARGRPAELRSTAVLRDLGAYHRSLGEEGEQRAPVALPSVGPAGCCAPSAPVFIREPAAMLGAARTANRYCLAPGILAGCLFVLTSDIGAFLAGETPLSTFGLTSARAPTSGLRTSSAAMCANGSKCMGGAGPRP
jgi:hypothetical protein